MKLVKIALAGVYLFGVYALPGRVCPHGEQANAAVSPVAAPTCGHCDENEVSQPQSRQDNNSCEKMVCCILPDLPRSGVAERTDLRGASSFVFSVGPSQEMVSAVHEFRLIRVVRVLTPPGSSTVVLSSSSLRGPPVV